jgi:hypothetical protein
MRALRTSIMLCAVLAGSASVQAEWDTTQGDAAHTGYVPMTVTSTPPAPLWSAPGMLVQSRLAVGGGAVFFVTHIPGTGWADSLYALNENGGAVLWKMSPASTTGDPAYSNGALYLQTVGSQSLVRGWNVQTQAQVFSSSFSNQGNTYLAPVISNGALYSGGGYYGGQVYSYNTANSAVNWATTVSYSGSYSGWTPAVNAKYVYAMGGGGSDLLIFDRTTGALLSESGPHAESLSGSLILTGNGGLFYIQNGTGYYVDVTNPASPHVIWSMPGLYEWDLPAYANGRIYVSANLNTSPVLYALDAATGYQEWSLAGARGANNMVVTNDVLFAAEGNSTVAIDLATHNVRWSLPQVGTLAVSDNTLFIGSDSSSGVTAYSIAAPEPSSLLLLASGVAGLLARGRHRRGALDRARPAAFTS